jgi:hypothetical protein
MSDFMETEIIESPSLFLTFEDRKLEDEFRFLYEQSTRKSIRAGLLFSLLAWSMGIGLAYLIIP